MSIKKEWRKKNADLRAQIKRAPQEQLKRLDDMFGPGKGAQKERDKLLAKINKEKEPCPTEEVLIKPE